MFSSIKMEEYMEFELSGIFWVKMVTTNIVFGSLWTHFVHMSVKKVKTCDICNSKNQYDNNQYDN